MTPDFRKAMDDAYAKRIELLFSVAHENAISVADISHDGAVSSAQLSVTVQRFLRGKRALDDVYCALVMAVMPPLRRAK